MNCSYLCQAFMFEVVKQTVAQVSAFPFAKKTKIWRPYCYILLLRAVRTKQGKIILEMKSSDLNIYRLLINFLWHVGKGENLLFIMPRFRVPSTHPWTMSAAVKTKWSLNILLPVVYFGLWKRINLLLSRVLCEAWWPHG